jgi:hypothetical protein
VKIAEACTHKDSNDIRMGLECAYWADGSGNINRGCKDLDLDVDKASTNQPH